MISMNENDKDRQHILQFYTYSPLGRPFRPHVTL